MGRRSTSKCSREITNIASGQKEPCHFQNVLQLEVSTQGKEARESQMGEGPGKVSECESCVFHEVGIPDSLPGRILGKHRDQMSAPHLGEDSVAQRWVTGHLAGLVWNPCGNGGCGTVSSSPSKGNSGERLWGA